MNLEDVDHVLQTLYRMKKEKQEQVKHIQKTIMDFEMERERILKASQGE